MQLASTPVTYVYDEYCLYKMIHHDIDVCKGNGGVVGLGLLDIFHSSMSINKRADDLG